MFSSVLVGSRVIGIPTIPFHASESGGTYNISAIKSIIVDEAYAEWVDKSGETLIPPSLQDFAGVFLGDFINIWGFQNIRALEASKPQPHSVFLTIQEKSPYKYASGEPSPEAYVLEVTSSGVTIRGASPLGVWWGTRSLLQLALLSGGELPIGKSVDVPGWKIRGMMLDAARHYYPSQVSRTLSSPPPLLVPLGQERTVNMEFVMLRCMLLLLNAVHLRFMCVHELLQTEYSPTAP